MTFILNTEFFKQWHLEQPILRNLRLEEVLEIFLSQDWEERLWVIPYRNSVIPSDSLLATTIVFLKTYNKLLTSFRIFLTHHIERITSCPLQGQEVVVLHRFGLETIAFQIKPCNNYRL